MWKWVLRGLVALSQKPALRAWVQRKARIVADRIRHRAELRVAALYDSAGLDVPKPKMTRLIRTEKDILRPGQVAVVDGKAFRVVRLVSSNARETAYEAVEA